MTFIGGLITGMMLGLFMGIGIGWLIAQLRVPHTERHYGQQVDE